MGKSYDLIRLEGLRANGHHGVFESERINGQTFSADLVMYCDLRQSGQSDQLDDTVDYSAVSDAVVQILSGDPSFLIEAVAQRIADKVLEFPRVAGVQVCLHKPQAPINAQVDDICVTLWRGVAAQDAPQHGQTRKIVSGSGRVIGAGEDDNMDEVDPSQETVSGDNILVTNNVPIGDTQTENGTHDSGDSAKLSDTDSAISGTCSEAEPASALLFDPPLAPRQVVLSLGANLGDPLQTLRNVVQQLVKHEAFSQVEVSALVRTTPVLRPGQPGQADYYNAVVVAQCALAAWDLLRLCQRLEDAHGRQRLEHWGPRTLDVDIIDIAGLTSDNPELMLPHPRAHERAFVLLPWSLLAPREELTGHGNIVALAEYAPDRQGIRRIWQDWWTPGAQVPEGLGEPPAHTGATPLPQWSSALREQAVRIVDDDIDLIVAASPAPEAKAVPGIGVHSQDVLAAGSGSTAWTQPVSAPSFDVPVWDDTSGWSAPNQTEESARTVGTIANGPSCIPTSRPNCSEAEGSPSATKVSLVVRLRNWLLKVKTRVVPVPVVGPGVAAPLTSAAEVKTATFTESAVPVRTQPVSQTALTGANSVWARSPQNALSSAPQEIAIGANAPVQTETVTAAKASESPWDAPSVTPAAGADIVADSQSIPVSTGDLLEPKWDDAADRSVLNFPVSDSQLATDSAMPLDQGNLLKSVPGAPLHRQEAGEPVWDTPIDYSVANEDTSVSRISLGVGYTWPPPEQPQWDATEPAWDAPADTVEKEDLAPVSSPVPTVEVTRQSLFAAANKAVPVTGTAEIPAQAANYSSDSAISANHDILQPSWREPAQWSNIQAIEDQETTPAWEEIVTPSAPTEESLPETTSNALQNMAIPPVTDANEPASAANVVQRQSLWVNTQLEPGNDVSPPVQGESTWIEPGDLTQAEVPRQPSVYTQTNTQTQIPTIRELIAPARDTQIVNTPIVPAHPELSQANVAAQGNVPLLAQTDQDKVAQLAQTAKAQSQKGVDRTSIWRPTVTGSVPAVRKDPIEP